MKDIDKLKSSGNKNIFKRLLDMREFMLLCIIVALFIALSLASSVFFSWDNFKAILLSVSTDMIVAVGMTILMVSGGFDLSVGSILGLSGMLTAMVLKTGAPVYAAILAGLTTGIVCGFINGLIVARFKINPFIATLSTQMLGRGFIYVFSQGIAIADLPASFKVLGQGAVFGVQYIIPIAVIITVLGSWLLRKSKYFRQFYFVGGNEKSAFLSGINVNSIKLSAYVIIGVLAAFAGILQSSRLGSASVNAGSNLEFRVITSVIIGGASLSGGEGSVYGTALGALLVALISNALTLFGVSVYWNQVVTGGTLLIAVMLDAFIQHRKLNLTSNIADPSSNE